MKTNINVKRIFLYGDSLVYGKKPAVNERWDQATRFSGALQNMLGNKYDVIEEGLRGRMLAGENSFFPERDGLSQFGPIFGSHAYVDLVIIALGSNDCNSGSTISEESIIQALEEYQKKIKFWSDFHASKPPKLIFVSPPKIDTSQYDGAMKTVFGGEASNKQVIIEDAIESYCQEAAIDYLIASSFCQPAIPGDGIHLNERGNLNLGKAIFEKIKNLV